MIYFFIALVIIAVIPTWIFVIGLSAFWLAWKALEYEGKAI